VTVASIAKANITTASDLLHCKPLQNVGGYHFDAAYASLKSHGRIAMCGAISQYNSAKPEQPTVDAMSLIYKSIRIEGFLSFDWLHTGEFLEPMSKWWKAGHLHIEESVHNGIEQWPTAFQSLFTGGNTGKVVVKVA
jgi:NADPH-dependent curcumin reductase CurA